MLFHSYNMFAGGEILINVIECEWGLCIPLEEGGHIRQKTEFQFHMPLKAPHCFARSNPKEKLSTGSQNLANKLVSNLYFSINALIQDYIQIQVAGKIA